MRIKRERVSDPSSSEEETLAHPNVRVKQEIVSDSEENSNIEKEQPAKKQYKRIKLINDSESSSDEDKEEEEEDEESESGIMSGDANNKSSDDQSSSVSSTTPSTTKRNLRSSTNSSKNKSNETKSKASTSTGKKRKILKRRKQRDNKKVKVEIVSSDEDEVNASSEEDSSSSSSSSSTKGNIEFESSSEVDEGSDKSYTSSAESEIQEDPSKKCCLVCRNLGNTEVKGRWRFNSASKWCKCGHCKIVGYMRDYDRVCCREMKDVVVFLEDEMEDASEKNMCITEHPRFEIDVLKAKALQRTGFSRTNYYGNNSNYESAWAFIRWIWNRIGYGTRMVVPACVSARIKENNKDGSTYFKSFSAVTTCETGKHCAASQHQ